MTEQFEVGDVVQLKSGGPRMTVVGADKPTPDEVHCAWFAKERMERAAFPPDALASIPEVHVNLPAKGGNPKPT